MLLMMLMLLLLLLLMMMMIMMMNDDDEMMMIARVRRESRLSRVVLSLSLSSASTLYINDAPLGPYKGNSLSGNIFKWLVSFHLRVIYHTRHSLGPIKFKRSVTETNHASLCMPALATLNISDEQCFYMHLPPCRHLRALILGYPSHNLHR